MEAWNGGAPRVVASLCLFLLCVGGGDSLVSGLYYVCMGFSPFLVKMPMFMVNL